MKVGIFYMHERYEEFAMLTLESVRRTMPGVEVWHLTDAVCQPLPGADEYVRKEEDCPMAVRRMFLHAWLDGDWCFVDADVIFQKDVRHVFEQPFDVAVTDRIGTITYEKKYAEAMPYNMGVTFSRSKEFWRNVLGNLLLQTEKLQEWTGDQMVVCEMAKRGGVGFDMKVLPGLVYNYPPKHEDGDVSDAAIVHFKGHRKKWIQRILTQHAIAQELQRRGSTPPVA